MKYTRYLYDYYKNYINEICGMVLLNIGNIYYLNNNDYNDNSYKIAYVFYKKSIEYNNIEAINNIGDMYFYGEGVKQSYKKAYEYYIKGLINNDSQLLYKIGILYFNGYYVDKNYDLALYYYKKSAEKFNKYALHELGNMYYYGYGVEQSYTKAYDYYMKCFELKYDPSVKILGDIYNYGYGIDVDYEKALYYYHKAEEYGNTDCYIWLGYLYYFGNGTERDFKQSYKYFLKSADLDNAYSIYFLGNMHLTLTTTMKLHHYSNINNIFNGDDNKIFNMYVSDESLDVRYDLINELKKDDKIAFEYFYKAAKLNNTSAINNLAISYYIGIYNVQNIKLAMYYLKKSIELHDDSYAYLLGLIYFTDASLENDELALKYLILNKYHRNIIFKNKYMLNLLIKTQRNILNKNINLEKYVSHIKYHPESYKVNKLKISYYEKALNI